MMKSINVSRLRADMAEHGYSNNRLSQILRCSPTTIQNYLNRGTVGDHELASIEAIFEREPGYYDEYAQAAPAQNSGHDEALYNLIAKMSTEISEYLKAQKEEMVAMNSTLQMLLASQENIKKAINKLSETENANISKVVTAVAKVRTDTEAIRTTTAGIGRKL